MADSATFPPKTQFSSTVLLETSPAVYGTVWFAFDSGEYHDAQTVDTSDIAAAIRDLFIGRGYTVAQFTAPVTTNAELDWPQGD